MLTVMQPGMGGQGVHELTVKWPSAEPLTALPSRPAASSSPVESGITEQKWGQQQTAGCSQDSRPVLPQAT